MENQISEKRIGDYIISNPPVKLQKGELYSVIDIDKITPGRRFVETDVTEVYSGQGGSKFENGDTLMARITPCLENGKIATCKITNKGFGSTELFVFRGKKNISDNDYVFYLMTQPYIRNLATNSMTGASGRQRADLDFIKKIKWNFPPLPTQKKIAEILSNYDALIENCQKRITCLEQMAQNLYKEWFVHFRFPGWEKANFENGLPAGWKIERMSSYCKITDGTHDTPKQTDEGIPLVTGRCISNGTINFSEAYFISKADSDNINKRSSLSTGDILFSNIGTIGNMCKVIYDRQFSVKNMIIFKPRTNTDSLYLYYFLQSNSVQQDMIAKANGASQQFVGLEFIRKYKILLPQKEILNSFESILSPLDKQKDLLQSQITNLRTQRDLLLPRLMSGKLETK